MKTLIFQSSPEHTGSTVLTNAIYGLIPELKDQPVIYSQKAEDINLDEIPGDIIVIKTHNTNIDKLISMYQLKCKLYFICSERVQKNLLIDNKYRSYNNVIIFYFYELNETKTNSINNIIQNIHDKIKKILNIELSIENGVNRIVSMNNLYEEIKNKDFKFYDKFYHIHGSHRNRK
jgi:hypothetical protein